MKVKNIKIAFLSTCLVISCALLFSSFKKLSKVEKTLPPVVSQYTFAFTLQPTANTGLISYWVVGVVDGKVVMKKPISETNFILQMQGKQYSQANTQGINMFEQIEMDSCFYTYNKKGSTCHPLSMYKLNDLWTLRYHRNPECPEGCTAYDGMRVQGLAANKAYPSDAQMAILKQYNVNHHTDFFYGDNMFKIFSDINNPDWTNAYEAAK